MTPFSFMIYDDPEILLAFKWHYITSLKLAYCQPVSRMLIRYHWNTDVLEKNWMFWDFGYCCNFITANTDISQRLRNVNLLSLIHILSTLSPKSCMMINHWSQNRSRWCSVHLILIKNKRKYDFIFSGFITILSIVYLKKKQRADQAF